METKKKELLDLIESLKIDQIIYLISFIKKRFSL